MLHKIGPKNVWEEVEKKLCNKQHTKYRIKGSNNSIDEGEVEVGALSILCMFVARQRSPRQSAF